jgi:hypothetical protein
MPLKVRLVLMGCAGFVVGLLLARLPWWAAVVVLIGAGTWAAVQLVSVERDLRRIRAELAVIEQEIAGG